MINFLIYTFQLSLYALSQSSACFQFITGRVQLECFTLYCCLCPLQRREYETNDATHCPRPLGTSYTQLVAEPILTLPDCWDL